MISLTGGKKDQKEEEVNSDEKKKADGGEPDKRKMPGKDTFIILILAGILLFIIAMPTKSKSGAGTGQKKTGTEKNVLTQEKQTDQEDLAKEALSGGVKSGGEGESEEYAAWIEEKLEKVLACMDGVGRVKTMVTVTASGQEIIEKDTNSDRSISNETDSAGGNRNVNDMNSEEATVYLTDAQGNKVPYVVKKLAPDVEGVIVVAEGGNDPAVCQNISEVIQALFSLEPHKIKVVRMRAEN